MDTHGFLSNNLLAAAYDKDTNQCSKAQCFVLVQMEHSKSTKLALTWRCEANTYLCT